jgi:hypothetical protein
MLKSPAMMTKSYFFYEGYSFALKNRSKFYSWAYLFLVEAKKFYSESVYVHFKWTDISKTDRCFTYLTLDSDFTDFVY